MKRNTEAKKDLSRRDFIKTTAVGVGATALAGLGAKEVVAQEQSVNWAAEADFIIAGAGAAGIPAAIEAAELGASVIVIDQNSDIGGYGVISGGNVTLGGGTKLQIQNGITDSADLVYSDLTNPNYPQTKKNNREMARVFADYNLSTNEWLEARGVKWRILDLANYMRFNYTIQTVCRRHATVGSGAGVFRPLWEVAKAKGVQVLLEHKLTRIIREKPQEGRVLGIEAVHDGAKVYLYASKGVLIATGGPKGNIQLRRLWDPRLTEEYQASGEPWAFHTGEGIIEAQKIGAQLTGDYGNDIHYLHYRASYLGIRYAMVNASFTPLTGFALDPKYTIHVNTGGLRFTDETISGMDKEVLYVDKAMVPGGPIWAIFDLDAVKLAKLDPNFPTVDPDLFFRADTILELANKIGVPPDALDLTVRKFNSYVDQGKDPEFGRPNLPYKIQTPPFYGAWATPYLHDTRMGLRTNEKAQVLDVEGEVIPALYAAGEATGGLDICGLAKCIVFGRIAAQDALAEA